jgi:amino acid transporter
MKSVAAIQFIITGGVIAATLSSAMATFLGAPRILQSLSGDRIFNFLLPFAKGSGPSNNPRRGVLLSAGIALATVSLGQLTDEKDIEILKKEALGARQTAIKLPERPLRHLPKLKMRHKLHWKQV